MKNRDWETAWAAADIQVPSEILDAPEDIPEENTLCIFSVEPFRGILLKVTQQETDVTRGMTQNLVPSGNRCPYYKTIGGAKIGMSWPFVGSLRDSMGNIPTSERCSYTEALV